MFFIVFIGLRYDVGGDWCTYTNIANKYQGLAMNQFYVSFGKEPIFEFLSFLSVYLGTSVYGINLLFASIFIYCLHKYLKSLPYYFIGFSISVPILITILAMGFAQQAVAVAFCMLSILALREDRKILFLFY